MKATASTQPSRRKITIHDLGQLHSMLQESVNRTSNFERGGIKYNAFNGGEYVVNFKAKYEPSSATLIHILGKKIPV